MEQKRENEMEQIFNNLTEDNKKVISLVAKGIEIAQENGKEN